MAPSGTSKPCGIKKNQPSGAQNRNKKKKQEALIKSLQGSMSKFVTKFNSSGTGNSSTQREEDKEIAYRILLTIPVSVATAKRSFSKLKLIKNYLRSTMSQERLNELAMLPIETDMVEKLDYRSLMDDFAGKNARRSIFQHRVFLYQCFL